MGRGGHGLRGKVGLELILRCEEWRGRCNPMACVGTVLTANTTRLPQQQSAARKLASAVQEMGRDGLKLYFLHRNCRYRSG